MEPLEVEYGQPIHQNSDQSSRSRKEKEKPPCGEEIENLVYAVSVIRLLEK